ncbi:MAG: efflux RND transporter periplasmic adaptor subunit [Paracoccaceae bacterium]
MVDRADEITATLNTARKTRTIPTWAWLAGAVAVIAAGWGWWSMQASGVAVSYVTEAATRGPLTVIVTATGTVQPTNQVEISSELSGTLSAIEVDFNDTVVVGQVLARLDTTKLAAMLSNAEASLAAATARVAQAEASLEEAAANFETAKELDRRGISTHQSFVASQAAFARASAAVQIARADTTLAEANLVLQKADLAKADIRSPINGVVLDRDADAGNIVASSLSAPILFVLAEDLTKMELQVDVDEADIGRVAIGNEASFTVEAHSGRVFPAQITALRYAPETTDGVVTYKAVLSVDNSDLALRPGMTATATIVVSRTDDALQVPNAALRFAPPQVADSSGSGSGLIGLIMPKRPTDAAVKDASAHSLWLLRDGVAVEVPVEIGDSDGKRTILTAGEVVEGDAVITDQSEAN